MILSTLAVLACGQQHQQYNNKDPRTAAIISEQRYLSGDGKFGAAYTQEVRLRIHVCPRYPGSVLNAL